MTATHPGATLRALMQSATIAAPGAYSGLVARAVARAGFSAAYVSGGALSADSGVPDIGLRSCTDFCRLIRDVADSSGLPVMADADTGFGEGEMTAKALRDYQTAGAAGFHLEDQTFPKRCGHLGGKSLIPIDHFSEKVAMAARARDESGGHFIVCARTDARSVEGLDAAIERGKAYVDAGADMIFPEGLHAEEEYAAFAEALAGYGSRDLAPTGGPYLLANITEFGKTPLLSRARCQELGYHFVIFPVSTLRIAIKAVEDFLLAVARDDGVHNQIDAMRTREELYDLLGYTPGEIWTYPNSQSTPASTQPGGAVASNPA